jgi:hypothetical protein
MLTTFAAYHEVNGVRRVELIDFVPVHENWNVPSDQVDKDPRPWKSARIDDIVRYVTP